MHFTLRIKLLIPAVLAIALGILIAVSYSYTSATREIELQLNTSLSREVSLSARLMDIWIEARQTDLLTWRAQEVYRDALSETGYYGKSAREGASRILSGLVAGYPYYDQLLLATPEGIPLASSLPDALSGIRVNDREYFKKAMGGENYVSGIIVSRGSGNRVFVLSVPLKEGEEVIGVLAGAVKLSYFSALFVDAFKLGRDGYAFLSDRSGEVVTISDQQAKGLLHMDAHLLSGEIPAGKGGARIREVDGVTRIYCFKGLRTIPWHFVVTLSLDEAFASSRTVGKCCIAVGLAILIAVSLLINLLFQRMIHFRLGKMLKVMGCVERGRLDLSIEDDTAEDEIGVLIKAFNTMIIRLKTTLDDLTGEVRVRRAAEEELKNHRHNLETLVKTRTVELEEETTGRSRAEEDNRYLQERLIRAEKMEALGTLAGGVAHDLNNILSGIVTYPDLLLLRLPEGSPLKKPLETIKESGIRAAAIVEDLLTMARRGVAVTEVVSLNSIVTDYLQSPEYAKLISSHPKVTLETTLHERLPHIDGSPVHLAKTVMNLVSNAAESMLEGGGIMIRTETLHMDEAPGEYGAFEAGDYAVLSISDTGMGIAPSDRKRIFEPFYTSKKMGISGTGLGMAVVWGTVKDHKGYIDLKSARGKGSTFILYFPISVREPGPLAKSALPIDDLRGAGGRILVVDDVAGQREIAVDLLSELGYSVTAVSSGEEAVEYVRKRAVDLLILDMIMEPGMDGLDTYRKIIEIRPEQKAIIASGFSETWRVKEALSIGDVMYIKKPYDIESIGTAVKRRLDAR